MSETPKSPIKTALRVLESEADGIRAVAARLDDAFARAVDLLAACRGKIAVSGMGKSGIVCKKIAATLSSTGSPAFFLHAAEAVHGDLGLLGANDIMLAVSKSGETQEILQILNVTKRSGIPLISLTGDPDSALARHADVNIDVGVEEEACVLGLAPTTSTTATMAMGDALAIALMERKGFKAEDFASFHPAGSLGKKLMKVADLMHTGAALPRVQSSTRMAEVIYEMSSKGLGMTTVVDERGALCGIISDGDLRRLLQRSPNPLSLAAAECMTATPKTIQSGELATAALSKMEDLRITCLVVVSSENLVEGVIHIHDLWRTQMF